jgi:hypothetical protein
MTKTATLAHTRTIDEIAEDFAQISDTGNLRLNQARLTYEFVGSTEGTEAAELRTKFLTVANAALGRRSEKTLSETAVVYFVNTWKYMLRANVDTNPETNPTVEFVAKAAYTLASQTFRKKEENYVSPAIDAIISGMDAEKAFKSATKSLMDDKAADNARKAAQKKEKESVKDETVTFDSIVATLGMLTAENFATLADEQKSIIRDLIATISVVVA